MSDEALPQTAKEIGTLWAQSNGDSQFVGSSSGVFFLKTVQKVFSSAAARGGTDSRNNGAESDGSSLSQWPTERIFGNEERADPTAQPRDRNLDALTATPWKLQTIDDGIMSQLVRSYFQKWHFMVPFLHGPSFLQNLEAVPVRRNVCQEVILQCICATASIDARDAKGNELQRNSTAEKLLPVLSLLALRDSIASIQALLSAQLYFVASMALRDASVVGGLIVRAVNKTGLHRCPVRYPKLSQIDRDMRKRVFWSAYVLDRFISQALGHPLGIQDSDVDVCLPGTPELHQPVNMGAAEDTTMHLPATHPDRPQHETPTSQVETESVSDSEQPEESVRQDNQVVFANFVKSSQFVGRTLETFHKSLHVRSAPTQAVLCLKADIDAWANDTICTWIDDPSDEVTGSSVFSTVAYHQLVLLVNRPFLCLNQNSAEFQSAIQTCVGASRCTIQSLRTYIVHNTIVWPGHLLAVWMSGLILAFACRTEFYSASNAISGLSNVLLLLKHMRSRWQRAELCHDVLVELLESIRVQEKNKKLSRRDKQSQTASRKRRAHFEDDNSPMSTRSRTSVLATSPIQQLTSDISQGRVNSTDNEIPSYQSRGRQHNSRNNQQSTTTPIPNRNGSQYLGATSMRYEDVMTDNGRSYPSTRGLLMPEHDSADDTAWYMGTDPFDAGYFPMLLDGTEWDSLLQLLTNPE